MEQTQAPAKHRHSQQAVVRFNRLGETDQNTRDQFQVRRDFQLEVQTS
jgi:hypothetical protein